MDKPITSIMDIIDWDLRDMAEENEWSEEKLNFMLSKRKSIWYYISAELDNQYDQYEQAFDNSTTS